MTFKITSRQCADEQDAICILQGMGFHVIVSDIPGADNELHWHDFDATFFIVDGDFAVACENDTGFQCAKVGDRVDAPRGILHRERHTGYRGVFGFPVDPTTLAMPLERQPPLG